MFSSDVRAIRIAELEAEGTRGDVQRLRQSCMEAAGLLNRTANLLIAGPMRKAQRNVLANELVRAADALHNLAALTKPKRSK